MLGGREGTPISANLPRFCPPPFAESGAEVIMEAAWGARRGGVLCLQAANVVVIIVPLR